MANIVITGANQGIGYYFTQQALKDGNNVAVLDIETDNLENLTQVFPNRLSYYEVDVCDELQINAAITDIIKKFDRIDFAIHNACLCTFDMEVNTDIDTYRDVFEVNYFGALRLVKSVLPYMRKQKSGKVIFTSSGVGVTGFMGISPYSSSKGAIESLAKCLRIEYAKFNISFHIFHPPLTRTKSSEPLPIPQEFMALPEKVGRGLAKHIKSKRFIICHSLIHKLQILCCYLIPIKMGNLLSKMTANYENEDMRKTYDNIIEQTMNGRRE